MQEIKEVAKRLLVWKNGKPAGPIKVIIQPTYKCNCNCLFCGINTARQQGLTDFEKELSNAEWMKVVKDCADLGIRIWWITGGGESFCRKGLTMKIMKYAKSLPGKTKGMLTTNGTRFSEKDIKEIVKLKWDEIQFSIDAHNAEKHNFLRNNPTAYQNGIKAIKLFDKYKKKYKSNKPVLQITAILSNYNMMHLSDMVSEAHKAGCQKITFTPIRIHDFINKTVKKNKVLLKKNKEKVVKQEAEKAKKLAKKLGIEFAVLIKEKKKRNHNVKKNQKKPEQFLDIHCYEPWYSFTINPYGEVGPCCSYGLGYNNLSVKTQNIKDIWQGDELVNVRSMFSKGKHIKKCKGCSMPLLSDEFKEEIKRINK